MTIAKNLKRTTVMACLTAFFALGVAGQAEAGHHHHKESKGRQAAGIIHAVADTIRAVTGQGYVVPAAPAVVAPTVVTSAPIVTPAPVIVPAPAIVNSYVPLLPSVTRPIHGYGHGPIVRPARVLGGPGHGGHGPVVVPTPRLHRGNHH